MKKEKGITLVALIITIIVLLILAVVTISAVNEGSLFSHANNAATKYDAAAKEENTMISNYLTELAKHDKESNGSSGNIEYYYITATIGGNLSEVVTSIDYDNNKFKVYGANYGENFIKYVEHDILEIVTEDFTVNLDGVDTVISNGKGIIYEVARSC